MSRSTIAGSIGDYFSLTNLRSSPMLIFAKKLQKRRMSIQPSYIPAFKKRGEKRCDQGDLETRRNITMIIYCKEQDRDPLVVFIEIIIMKKERKITINGSPQTTMHSPSTRN